MILQKTCESRPERDITMTANTSIDPAGFLAEHLERAEPDLLRAMVKTFVEALMGAEADALCGAPYGASGLGKRTSSNAGTAPQADSTSSSARRCAAQSMREAMKTNSRPGRSGASRT